MFLLYYNVFRLKHYSAETTPIRCCKASRTANKFAVTSTNAITLKNAPNFRHDSVRTEIEPSAYVMAVNLNGMCPVVGAGAAAEIHPREVNTIETKITTYLLILICYHFSNRTI